MTAYFRRMAEAMPAAMSSGHWFDEAGNFKFSEWVERSFDPAGHAHPRPLPIDGRAYRRRTHRRKP